MKRRMVGGLILSAIWLSACSSPDLAFYTLSPVAAPQPSSQEGHWTHPYRIAPVNVPAQVDDTTLVVRQSSDQMMVLSYDRWSATLSEQFRDALSLALTQQLGMPPMQNLASSSALRDVTQITVDVQRFELIPGQAALLDAVWRISPLPAVKGKGQKPGSAITCYSVLRSDSGIGVAALVAAQQRNLMTLSEQIAQVLRTGQAAATHGVAAPGCY